MSTINAASQALSNLYLPTVASAKPSGVSQTAGSGASSSDSVEISPAALRQATEGNRITYNLNNGTLTSDQATQLQTQLAANEAQITSLVQADGGTLTAADRQTVQQLQGQLSQSIYSDAHDGATAPTGQQAGAAGVREALQFNRIAANAQNGNLTSDQASQLDSQLSAIHTQISTDLQNDGGTLSLTDAQAINAMQSAFSKQIASYVNPDPSGVTGTTDAVA